MDFGLNMEQEMLRKSFSEYLEKNCRPEDVKEMIQSEEGFSRNIWQDMARLGWMGLCYHEKYEGTGGAFFDLFILFEELGKVLLPSPLFTSAVLSGLLIERAGNNDQKMKHLPPLIQGERIFTLACMDNQGNYNGNAIGLKARTSGNDTYILEGSMFFVPYAHAADMIIACADLADTEQSGPTLFLVDRQAENLRFTDLKALGIDKEYAVQFEGVPVSKDDILGEAGAGYTYINEALFKGIALKCGEMLGAMNQVLDMTVKYAKQRHQFGRPHPLATLPLRAHRLCLCQAPLSRAELALPADHQQHDGARRGDADSCLSGGGQTKVGEHLVGVARAPHGHRLWRLFHAPVLYEPTGRLY